MRDRDLFGRTVKQQFLGLVAGRFITSRKGDRLALSVKYPRGAIYDSRKHTVHFKGNKGGFGRG